MSISDYILIIQNFTDCTLGKTILGNVKELNIYDDDNHHCLKIEKKTLHNKSYTAHIICKLYFFQTFRVMLEKKWNKVLILKSV